MTAAAVTVSVEDARALVRLGIETEDRDDAEHDALLRLAEAVDGLDGGTDWAREVRASREPPDAFG